MLSVTRYNGIVPVWDKSVSVWANFYYPAPESLPIGQKEMRKGLYKPKDYAYNERVTRPPRMGM